jgi:hypothetical protein
MYHSYRLEYIVLQYIKVNKIVFIFSGLEYIDCSYRLEYIVLQYIKVNKIVFIFSGLEYIDCSRYTVDPI